MQLGGSKGVFIEELAIMDCADADNDDDTENVDNDIDTIYQ